MLDTTDKMNNNLQYVDCFTGQVKPLNRSALKNLKNAQKRFAKQGLRTLLMSYKPADMLPFGLAEYTGSGHKAHSYLVEPN